MSNTFTVSNGEIKSFLLWGFALFGCIYPAVALLIRLGCKVNPKDVLMLLGYTVAGFLIFPQPLFKEPAQTTQVWNIRGLIAASSLCLLNLTEAFFFLYYLRRVIRKLKSSYKWFWVIAQSTFLLVPTVCSIILFSPISLNKSGKLGLVHLASFAIDSRSILAVWAYSSLATGSKSWWRWKYKAEKNEASSERGSATTSAPASKRMFKIAAIISTIESLVLVGYSIVAYKLFSPDYILNLGTITAVSRSYIAYAYYGKNHGYPPADPASIESAAAERTSKSVSSTTIYKPGSATEEEPTRASPRRSGTSSALTDTQPEEVAGALNLIEVSTTTYAVSETIEGLPPSPPQTPPHTP